MKITLRLRHHLALAASTAALLVLPSCGNDDYAKAIQKYADAASALSSAAAKMYNDANAIEDGNTIDTALTGHQAIDVGALAKNALLTPEQIKVRIAALGVLSRYGEALLALATSKTTDEVAKQFKDLGTSFQTLGADAVAAGNPAFSSGLGKDFKADASAVGAAIGTIAQAIEEHRARSEIERQITGAKPMVDALLATLSVELDDLHQRQKSALGSAWVHITEAVNVERRKPNPEDGILVLLAERAKAVRGVQAELTAADPQPALKAMIAAHDALCKYVSSDKSPASFGELIDALKDFLGRAQTIHDGIAALAGSH